MRRTVVIDLAGLSAGFIGDRTPHLTSLARRGGSRLLRPILPAVGPAVQATFTTGLLPRSHGCVGSGWYSRELAEVHLGRGSSKLVAGERIWEVARRLDPAFTAASIFWSHEMYGTTDWSVSPSTIERADGRRADDIHTHPASLRGELVREVGEPAAREPAGFGRGLAEARWIARCARHVYSTRLPALTMVAVPHLDRALQRLGPDHPEVGRELELIDAVVGELIEHVERDGARVIVLSSHAVVPVAGPVHINRGLRQAQLLAVREDRGRELFDPGASEAFAIADHQIAHVYVRRPEQVAGVKALLGGVPGIEAVLDRDGVRACGLDHERSGELVAIAAPDRWFTYYWWTEDRAAPELARTVDPARKPGSDPGELFLDPTLVFPQLRLAWKGLLRTLGFRALLDVVPINAGVVRGSHGRVSNDAAQCPLLITSAPELVQPAVVDAADVKRLVLDHLFDTTRKIRASEEAQPEAPAAHHLQLLDGAAAVVAGNGTTKHNGTSV